MVVNEIQTGDALIAEGAIRNALLVAADRSVCDDRWSAGRSGSVRRAGDDGTAPHGGDRRTHGAWRRTGREYFSLVVAQGFRLSAIGVACGLIAAFGLTRLMKAMLVGVRATDPGDFRVRWCCCSC